MGFESNAGGVSLRYADPDTAWSHRSPQSSRSELARVTDFLGVSRQQSFQLVVWPDGRGSSIAFVSCFGRRRNAG